ncbi:molybdenum ABC transporter permease [Candidatus Bathyarchaeota archaeon]|nr:MAG: molybdenum ABC transporter permease [Candidatus Bathyarchaeota archaeon]
MKVGKLSGKHPLKITFSILGAIIILFLTIPILTLYLLTKPEGFIGVFYDDEAVKAIILSILAATTSTIICLIFGVPLAFILARYNFKAKSLINSIIDLPLVIPHSVAGIAILSAYHSRSPLGWIFSNFGLIIEDSFWGIVAAMVFVSITILINSAKDGFSLVNREYEYVARSLGAGLTRIFFTIYIPLSFKPILSGVIMCWARAMSEVGAILIVAYFPKTAPVLIVERFLNYGLTAARPIAAVLLLVSVTIFMVLRFIGRGKR